jgi:hypothetical protein
MNLKQIRKATTLLALVLGCYTINAQNVSRYIETYKGTRGLTVDVTRYGEYEKNQALVRFSGFDHPWSDHIFLCTTTFTSTGMKVSYNTLIDGKEYELMITNGGDGTVWLKGGWAFDIKYEGTFADQMQGRNELVNSYNNSTSKTNPR